MSFHSLELCFTSTQHGLPQKVTRKVQRRTGPRKSPAFSLADGNREDRIRRQPSARATASASPAHPSAYGISEKPLKAKLFRELTVHCSSSSPINWRAEACNRSAKHRQQQLKSTGALTAEVSGAMTVSTLKNVSLYIYGLGFFWTRSQRYV